MALVPSSERREEEEESTEGKLYFKFSETRVPCVVRKVLEESGWREWDPEKHPESLWSLHWKSGRFKLSDWDRCLPHQRINHCPKTSNITKKDNLHRNMKRLAGSYGAVYNFVPTTYVLPNEYVNFMREYAEQSEPQIWICKPSDSSRGRGIFLIRDMSELIYDQQYIIQRYIKDPLLIGGFKFDLRLYVLVPTFQPMRAYMYEEGLVRFATEKYSCSQTTDLTNVYSHLTNSSINKYSPSLNENKAMIGPGCKWPLSRLLKYFEDGQMDSATIMQRIKNIIVLTLLALWPKVPAQESGFELLGFDVMLDSQLDPWLIEVNASPALATDTSLDMQVKAPLLADTLKVLGMKPQPIEQKKRGRVPLSHSGGSISSASNRRPSIDRPLSNTSSSSVRSTSSSIPPRSSASSASSASTIPAQAARAHSHRHQSGSIRSIPSSSKSASPPDSTRGKHESSGGSVRDPSPIRSRSSLLSVGSKGGSASATLARGGSSSSLSGGRRAGATAAATGAKGVLMAGASRAAQKIVEAQQHAAHSSDSKVASNEGSDDEGVGAKPSPAAGGAEGSAKPPTAPRPSGGGLLPHTNSVGSASSSSSSSSANRARGEGGEGGSRPAPPAGASRRPGPGGKGGGGGESDAKVTRIGGYELIFPATPELERLRNQGCRGGGAIDIKPVVTAVRELELQARRKGRLVKAEKVKQKEEIQALLPKAAPSTQQGPWWMSN